MKTKKLKTLPKGEATLIGRGSLTWFRGERVSDRYGSVWLLSHVDSTTATHEKAEMWFPKGRGKLIARVIEARDSTHIGDLFRGLSPRTPKTGDIIVLGEGAAFVETCEGDKAIGLMPNDGRSSDWLNPRALYDCHESVVELIWIPTP